MIKLIDLQTTNVKSQATVDFFNLFCDLNHVKIEKRILCTYLEIFLLCITKIKLNSVLNLAIRWCHCTVDIVGHYVVPLATLPTRWRHSSVDD